MCARPGAQGTKFQEVFTSTCPACPDTILRMSASLSLEPWVPRWPHRSPGPQRSLFSAESDFPTASMYNITYIFLKCFLSKGKVGKQIYNALFSQASLPPSAVVSPRILSIFPPGPSLWAVSFLQNSELDPCPQRPSSVSF